MERRRRNILQELEDSIPITESAGKEDDVSPEDTAKNIHLADTVPVHLHPGHPPTRDPSEGYTVGQSQLSSSEQSKESTTDHPDSSSTVLPLSEESIPFSREIIQPSKTPSLSHRSSTPAQQRDTHAKPLTLARPHTITSDESSSTSYETKINVDLDVGSSSLVESDSTLGQDQHQEHETKSHISSTEYYSPPSEVPRRQSSLQEIEDNLKRIKENRQNNWNLLNHLSWKRESPGSHTPIKTYLEKLKEEGSGKKPVTRKEKFEHQKRALIQFYIQKLLQRKDREEDISASTVEGSGLTVSSLSSLFSYLEGEREGDQPTDLPSITSSSPTSSYMTSRSLSTYEDIDEFPVRMKPQEHEHLPSHVTTTPSLPVHTDPHYISTSIMTSTTTSFSSSSSSIPSQLQHHLSSSSSIKHPSYCILKPHIHPLHSISTSGQKQATGDFLSTTNGSYTTRYVFLLEFLCFVSVWDKSN